MIEGVRGLGAARGATNDVASDVEARGRGPSRSGRGAARRRARAISRRGGAGGGRWRTRGRRRVGGRGPPGRPRRVWRWARAVRAAGRARPDRGRGPAGPGCPDAANTSAPSRGRGRACHPPAATRPRDLWPRSHGRRNPPRRGGRNNPRRRGRRIPRGASAEGGMAVGSQWIESRKGERVGVYARPGVNGSQSKNECNRTNSQNSLMSYRSPSTTLSMSTSV
jgi:hypothetical protein